MHEYTLWMVLSGTLRIIGQGDHRLQKDDVIFLNAGETVTVVPSGDHAVVSVEFGAETFQRDMAVSDPEILCNSAAVRRDYDPLRRRIADMMNVYFYRTDSAWPRLMANYYELICVLRTFLQQQLFSRSGRSADDRINRMFISTSCTGHVPGSHV